jgi:flagellar hook-associated protein 1 FlgK
MSGYHIGLSGLDAAQKALDIIANNISNAATEGYHLQRIELAPAYSAQTGGVLLGGGVDIKGVTRMIDDLLEQEILRQRSVLEYVSQKAVTLATVENTFGELSSGTGLNAAIDEFFNALNELSAHPGEIIWQNQVVLTAEAMANQFRMLGDFLTNLEDQIRLTAENSIEQVNTLINQIAELNGQIARMEIVGTDANNLRDQRDQYLTELSEFINIQTQSREYGVVDVVAGGINVVTSSSAVELEVGFNENGSMGIGAVGAYNYFTSVQGGQIGGLLSLKNNTLADIHSDLDDLASAIIKQINQCHVQGVGSDGSFTELTGWTVADADGEFADYTNPSVTDGSIFIRIINTSTGEITREEITVDADAGGDTLNTLAAAIDALDGVSASVISSKLHIVADTNYKFDFLPAVLPSPEAADINFNGLSDPTVAVSGVYTGSSNDTFTFTVTGTGDIGNDPLTLTVTNGDGETVTTFNIGSGYAAGDKLDLDNGLKISLSIGDLVDGDSFSIDAFANTDTSGVLAALGINTFFSGSSASDIAVCSDISAAPDRIATALGAEMTDNTNAQRLAELKDQSISALNSMTPGEFYRGLVTDIGQQLMIERKRQDSLEGIIQNLINRQGEISGVDINEQAAQMLVFEQMFQAMAKYMNTLQSSFASLMEIV